MTELGEHGYMEKTPENIEWVRQLLNDPTKQVVFHNAKFDLKMFFFEGIDIFSLKGNIYCTLIMSKLYNMNGLHDLRWLGIKHLHRNTDEKDEVIIWLEKNKKSFFATHGRAPNFSDAPRDVVKRRVLWDVKTTLMLYKFFSTRIDHCQKLHQNERDLMYVVIDMENTGVRVDVTRARKLKAECERGMAIIQERLNKLVCPFTIVKNKKRKRKGEVYIEQIEEEITEFNTNSSRIHLPTVWQKMGIPLRFKTKPKKKKDKKTGEKVKTGGGNWSFDEYAMMRYVSKELAGVMRDSGEDGWSFDKWDVEIASTMTGYSLQQKELLPPYILKLNELQKLVSTYYDHLIEIVVDRKIDPITGRETGILHCSFNPTGAMSGRFSSNDPNLQNMPRILGPRECFIPRKSRNNWHFDYEQVEMKLFTHFARDKDMAAAIAGDIHLYVASQIYNVPMEEVSKERRKRAKAVNFGIIYGSGAATMAEALTKKGLPTSVYEAQTIVEKYHRRFPSIRKITRQYERDLKTLGYVTNPFGRRYHIPSDYSYTALNYMCQGTSADLIKFAMVRVWKWLRSKGVMAKMLLQVHDELCIEMPPIEQKELVPAIVKEMEDPDSYFIPITVDAEVAHRRWSEKQDPSEYGVVLN